MRCSKTWLLTNCLVALFALSATCCSGIIFQDEFSTSPAINGWSSSIDSAGSAVGAISLAPSAQQVVLEKISGSGAVHVSIARTVATSGYENITLNLSAFQSATGFESADFLEIEYDTGSGFVSLLKDVEVWNGEIDLAGEGSSGTDGQNVAISTGELILPQDAADNLLLQVRISASVNANAEDYFLDHITVSGTSTAIPEPSSLICLGMIACFALGKALIRGVQSN